MRLEYPQYLTSNNDAHIPASNMVERLIQHENNLPDKTVYFFLEDGVLESSSITYSGLVKKAKAIAAALLAAGNKGDRVLLLFPTGIPFITAFFGCFFAGMVAVPAYPPKRSRPNERFKSIVESSSPAFILSTQDIHSEILASGLLEGLPDISNMIVYEDISVEGAISWRNPGIDAGDIAMLQYTSGSTGTPNGVMVSHDNIIHNSECIKQSFGFDEATVGVNWLPNFHDMGLIGCLIQAAYLGATNVIIPPLSFLKNPANWFRSITKYKATTAGGPNFAFDYSMERITDEEINELDLSHLRTLYCGAEPIREATLNNFTKKFKPARFSAEQFYPCYGLAESVLIATGGDFRAEPLYFYADARALEENNVVLAKVKEEARVLTACGYPWLGMSVVIVDTESIKPAAAGKIGEIWLKGPSVAMGYWDEREKTAEVFNAYIDGTDDGPWLRTGDLGFILDRQLYVSGRLKDLIIIRGSNFFPNDIENSVENCHEALRKNACAAFSIDISGEERLVITAEIERSFMRNLPEDEIFEVIRSSVFMDYGIQPYAIALLKTGSIEKTSSGKIQRYAMKRAWLYGGLNVVASRVLKADKENIAKEFGYRPEFLREWMIQWMAQHLEINPRSIDPDKPVSAYGLDSISAVSLERDVNKQFGVEWPIESFLKDSSVNQLVEEGIRLLYIK